MAKEAKTNAMRMLDRQKVKYETLAYECDEFIDGIHCADITGAPYEQSFKTLVMEGKSGGYYVFVVPIEKEVDRKAAAKAVGEKAVDMIHVKDITKITGYVRGGCSPIGMKKPFPTVFDASAGNFQEIYVSGGRIGLTLKVPVADLLKVTGGKQAVITAEELTVPSITTCNVIVLPTYVSSDTFKVIDCPLIVLVMAESKSLTTFHVKLTSVKALPLASVNATVYVFA